MADAVKQLLDALHEELAGQQELANVLAAKLEAMQRYDMPALDALVAREHRLAEQLRQRSMRRTVAAQRLTVQLFPKRRGQVARARELAAQLPAPKQKEILSVSEMLSEWVEKVQRLNRVNAVATQKIMKHLDHIFKVITKTGVQIGLYGREGKMADTTPTQLVDALA